MTPATKQVRLYEIAYEALEKLVALKEKETGMPANMTQVLSELVVDKLLQTQKADEK